MFSFVSTGAPVQKCSTYDLVDEKGGHEDIHEFASKSDIVVCCLSLNSETVRLLLCLVILFHMLLPGMLMFMFHQLQHQAWLDMLARQLSLLLLLRFL